MKACFHCISLHQLHKTSLFFKNYGVSFSNEFRSLPKWFLRFFAFLTWSIHEIDDKKEVSLLSFFFVNSNPRPLSWSYFYLTESSIYPFIFVVKARAFTTEKSKYNSILPMIVFCTSCSFFVFINLLFG